MSEQEKPYERQGSNTSEAKVVAKASWLGIAITIAGTAETFLQASDSVWSGVVMACIGLFFTVLNAMGYATNRSRVKEAAARVDAANAGFEPGEEVEASSEGAAS